MKLLAILVIFIMAVVYAVSGLKNEVCGEPHSKNLNGGKKCLAYIPSWTYNGQECIEFIYGGCGGNGNRFDSLEECAKKCVE